MANREQYGMAFLRIVLVAVATLIVGTIVITFAFLSSGNESDLLPPWQLVVAEIICVAILLLLSLNISRFESGASIFRAAITIATIFTIVVAAYWGVGHTWGRLSFVGKAISVFVTLAYPILISAGAIIVMRKRSARITTIWAVSMMLCLLFTVPMILVGGVLACAAGDCL